VRQSPITVRLGTDSVKPFQQQIYKSLVSVAPKPQTAKPPAATGVAPSTPCRRIRLRFVRVSNLVRSAKIKEPRPEVQFGPGLSTAEQRPGSLAGSRGDEKSRIEFLSNRRLKTIYRRLVFAKVTAAIRIHLAPLEAPQSTEDYDGPNLMGFRGMGTEIGAGSLSDERTGSYFIADGAAKLIYRKLVRDSADCFLSQALIIERAVLCASSRAPKTVLSSGTVLPGG